MASTAVNGTTTAAASAATVTPAVTAAAVTHQTSWAAISHLADRTEGGGNGTWGRTYHDSHGQHWADTSANDDGQLPDDGNIA